MDWTTIEQPGPVLPFDDGDLGGLDDGPLEVLDELMRRRDAGEILPRLDEPAQLSTAHLEEMDLSGLDLSGADLSYAELIHCSLRGARLVGTNLRGAVLRDIDLSGAELEGANLEGAELAHASLSRAGLRHVKASEASFFGARCQGANFTGADLREVDFQASDLSTARFIQADLTGADFGTAVMTEIELVEARVEDVAFRSADLRNSHISRLQGYRSADWIDTNVNDVDFTGAWKVRRHIQDTNFIHEFRIQSRKNEMLYWLWWVTSDCGRSLARWTMWTLLVALLYSGAYTQVAIDWGGSETSLSPLYFSIVTFTTLGFGDVLPASSGAQALVISEVILGYLSLGGLMSILSDKMARRAG